MKKICFVLMAMILCAFAAFGQKDVKVRFGVEGGFNMTQWNGNLLPDYSQSVDNFKRDLSDAGIKPGFHAGVLADLVIQTHWSIQPEVLFTMEGSKVTQNLRVKVPSLDPEAEVQYVDSVAEKNVTAFYIRIPILVYYNITNVGPGQLSPGIGFFFAGGVGGSVEGGGKTFGDDGVLDEFDWGLNVKVNYEMQKKVSGLFAGIGFSQGFSTSKSTGLSVSVGYKFQYAKFLKRAYNTGILEYNP